MVAKTAEDIREEWLSTWKRDAEADGGAWLMERFGQPEADLSTLIGAMLDALAAIPVDDPDGDWDPNFGLYWQRYGMAPEEESLATLRLLGPRSVVIFAEADAFDELGLDEMLRSLEPERIVLELCEADDDEMREAVAFVEEGLGLPEPEDNDIGVLPWSGDTRRVEVDLRDSQAVQVVGRHRS